MGAAWVLISSLWRMTWMQGMEKRLGELGQESDQELMKEDHELQRESRWLASHRVLSPPPAPCLAPPRGRDVPCGVSSQSQRSSSDVHAASRRTMLSFTLAFFYSCFLPATSLEPTCSGFLGATYPCFLRATYSCFLPDLTPSQARALSLGPDIYL